MNGSQERRPEYSLRDFRIDDCQDLVQHLSNQNISKWLRRVPEPYLESDARKFICDLIQDEKSINRVFHKKAIIVSDKVVGCVGLQLDDANKSGMIGYWLAEEYWGRGIMTHAARQMIDYGFTNLGLLKIMGWTDSNNVASKIVLTKLGFKYVGDGTVTKCNGKIVPINNYELTNPE